MRFKTGCIKDKKDKRDYLMRVYLPVVKLPVKTDYTKTNSGSRTIISLASDLDS